MKNAIAKFLGLDKVQKEATELFQEVQSLRNRMHEVETENVRLRGLCDQTINIDYSELGCEIDYSSLSYEVDSYDVACNIEMYDLAQHLDYQQVAESIDYTEFQNHMTDALDMDILAQTVSEKIADRDGMHQMISEEIENQGVGNISTDAVQSMIDTTIQQFADSLEVMVSAKLNINK
jgi:hypothetical protein